MNTATKSESIRFANGMTESEVVTKYLPAFTEVYETLRRPGTSIVYNDEFLGQIDGLAGTPDEGRAIYWLQGARRIKAHEERVAAGIEDGWIPFEHLTAAEREIRPESVLIAGRGKVRNFKQPDGTVATVIGASVEWIEIPRGRVVVDPLSGEPTGVLPKGARSCGTQVGYRRILVKLPQKKRG